MTLLSCCGIAALLLATPALAQTLGGYSPLSPTKTHPCGHGNQPACPPPPPPPITLSLAFDPPNPSIPDTSPVGTVLAQIIVTVSDGSVFMGSLGFGNPYISDNGFCAISGKTLILGIANPLDGLVQCTITATQ